MLKAQQAQAQQTLDELFREKLLPFELFAKLIESIGGEEYIVRFYDSRLRSLDLSWRQDQCFKDVFRKAVLERVGRFRGSLQEKWPTDRLHSDLVTT